MNEEYLNKKSLENKKASSEEETLAKDWEIFIQNQCTTEIDTYEFGGNASKMIATLETMWIISQLMTNELMSLVAFSEESNVKYLAKDEECIEYVWMI